MMAVMVDATMLVVVAATPTPTPKTFHVIYFRQLMIQQMNQQDR